MTQTDNVRTFWSVFDRELGKTSPAARRIFAGLFEETQMWPKFGRNFASL
jgi:hypothetical protein